MNHLQILKWLNWLSVVMLALTGLLTVGSIGLTLGAVVMNAPEAAAAIIPSAIVTGLVMLLLAGMFVLALVSALGIEKGRARVAQTILAVSGLTSLPFGTAFGVYAIWVCWFNEETKATFDSSRVGRELALLGVGLFLLALPLVPVLGLSIAALIPNDLAALDAEWEPIEDRSQRVAGEGCALTQVGPDCAAAQVDAVLLEEVVFPTRSQSLGFTELKGTLHVPEGLADRHGPRPAVVLVHGSGPTDRDAAAPGEVVKSYSERVPIFEKLADHLAMQGLIVLRYDKRACPRCYPDEHANADYSKFRFALFQEDAHAAADYLASRVDVDGTALVVIGHSQGGGFAPHIAAADDRFVAAVMLAGFSGTFRDAIVDQLNRVADIRAERWDWFTAWALQLQASGYAGCLDQIDGDHDPEDMCLGGGVPLQAVAEYDAFNATTRTVIGGLEVPLCVIAGTVDRNVPPEELLAIRDATKGGDAEFHLISGVGHGLLDLVNPDDPVQIDPVVLERLDGFLASVRLPPPEPEPEEDELEDGEPDE